MASNVTERVQLNTSHVLTDAEKRRILLLTNDEKTEALIPVLVYILLLMITGIIGNSIVLYIYKVRFKRSSSRAFILCLAILDFITCIFGVPYHLYDIYNPYTYEDAVSCKVLSFSMAVTLLSSVFILGLISIDRYQKICRPFGKQLSDFGTKKSLHCCCSDCDNIFDAIFGFIW